MSVPFGAEVLELLDPAAPVIDKPATSLSTRPRQKSVISKKLPKINTKQILEYIENTLEEYDDEWVEAEEALEYEFINGKIQALFELITYFGYDPNYFQEYCYTDEVTKR